MAVGSNDFDTGTTVRLSRSMYDGINYTEDTAVVLETNEDQGAVTLLRNNQKALLGVDAGGAHVDLIDFDTESVAVMGADADGPLLLLIQQEPGVVLAANSEGAGMALGLIGNDYVPYLELDGTISNGGSLYLYNAMGGTRGILSSEEGTGNGGLWLYNRTGTEYQSLTYE